MREYVVTSLTQLTNEPHITRPDGIYGMPFYEGRFNSRKEAEMFVEQELHKQGYNRNDYDARYIASYAFNGAFDVVYSVRGRYHENIIIHIQPTDY